MCPNVPLSRWQRTWVRILAGIGAILLLSACTTTIIAPRDTRQPQPVFVLDHGRHTSLVLPHPDGLVRYAYGDWDWYAEVEVGAVEATSAVLWPTRAGLGRRQMEGTATTEGVRQATKVGIQHLYRIWVDTGAIDALRLDLDRMFRANLADWKYNRAYDLEFVPHPEPYSAWHNSNHVVARWLRRLGCTVQGSAFWADWKVETPSER